MQHADLTPEDVDYALLKQLDVQGNASQRDLALQMGISLGKLNYCLRAFIERGWVKVNNFRRSDNKWAYSYYLTPMGAAAKIRLAREFLTRKEREFEAIRAQIAFLRQELSALDMTALDGGASSSQHQHT